MVNSKDLIFTAFEGGYHYRELNRGLICTRQVDTHGGWIMAHIPGGASRPDPGLEEQFASFMKEIQFLRSPNQVWVRTVTLLGTENPKQRAWGIGVGCGYSAGQVFGASI